MIQFVLDTDTLTLLSHGHPGVTSQALSLSPDSLAITIISVEEVFIGRYSQIRRSRTAAQLVAAYGHLQNAVELFRRTSVLPYDQAAQETFAKLRSVHRRMSTNDLRIASIAIAHRTTLVTRNTSDFANLRELTTADWTL